jgi:hypothetical protein
VKLLETVGEARPLKEAREQQVPWRRWGPYLSERQWGTVRDRSFGHRGVQSSGRNGEKRSNRGSLLSAQGGTRSRFKAKKTLSRMRPYFVTT